MALKKLTRDGSYYPGYTTNSLSVHSHLLHHFLTYNIIPHTDHREKVHLLDIFLIDSILVGKPINSGFILTSHMREAGTKKSESPKSLYDKVAIEHLHWHFDNKSSNWSYKGKDTPSEQEEGGVHDDDEGDLGKNQEGRPSTTQEAPSSFNFEVTFQLMNARMDTLVKDFNAFEEAQGRQVQELHASQQARFNRFVA
ncbi:hypothetical protein PanWU01x14_031800 [Parasponia andersonii]|uniref:Uncharacterized protein n=1 Tax=Parasponia andersonii TaxID=3476 RepID=A0A2P5DU91_PARAD|nr:hypothetical protein PanWU01x14_031800 [Parasponia andersonii]